MVEHGRQDLILKDCKALCPGSCLDEYFLVREYGFHFVHIITGIVAGLLVGVISLVHCYALEWEQGVLRWETSYIL